MVNHVFGAADIFLLRAPVADLDTFGLLAAEADALASLVGATRTRVALRAASRSLSEELERALAEAGETGPVTLTARARSSLLRYLTRMCSRPTPYGLFAGVATGRFGDATDLGLADDPLRTTRTRTDLGWLLELLRRMDAAAFAEALPVTVNPLLYRVGDRATLPTADVHGQADARRVEFRVTEPVRLALSLATGTVRRDVLCDLLREAFPRARPEQIVGLIDQLAALNVLVTALRPDLTRPRPEVGVAERLAQVPGAQQAGADLRVVADLAAAVDRAIAGGQEAGGPLAAVERLADAQLALTDGYEQELFQVDAQLGLRGRHLHRDVALAAAEAAELLHRIGCLRPRLPHLADYHNLFLEHYGLHTEVPVTELLSPELGLDVPNGYSRSPRPIPLPSGVEPDDRLTHRDQSLAAMTVGVLALGSRILELTDDRLERLTVWRPGEGPAVRPSVDLFCQIAAASSQAVDAGDWSLIVSTGACTDGARSLGRFFDLLDPADGDVLGRFAADEEELLPGVVHAELSYVPSHGRSANVTVHPPVRGYEICVNTAPSVAPDRCIPLSEIDVGALSDRFYLRWRRTGQELRVTQSHLLVTTAAPDVCRFLLEASDDGFTPLPAFDWGTLARSPFLPRVVRGRVVLHPAQWLLSPATLELDPRRPPDDDAFERALHAWRERWQVPRHVYLTWLDNRLLLDLDHPSFRAELAGELRRAFADRQPLVLQEMLPDVAGTWLGAGGPDSPAGARRHVFEIVVPLRAVDPALVARPAPPSAATTPATTTPATVPRRFVPGSEWVYVKLYAAASRHDALLSTHLAPLLHGLRDDGLIREWFFVRYADPLPHLRLRVRAAAPGAGAELTARVLGWAGDCVAQGLASDVVQAGYVRELERYGGPATVAAVEQAFSTSSDLAVGLLSARAGGALTLPAEVLHVWAVHLLHRAWGRDPVRDLPELRPRDQDDALRRRFRELRATLCGLLRPWPAHPDPAAEAARPVLAALAAPHMAAVADLAEACRSAAEQGRLHGTPRDVVTSLAHMELNRLAPLGEPPDERVRRLWQLTAGALRRRPDVTGEPAAAVPAPRPAVGSLG